MKRWSLKIKFGAFASGLVLVALVLSAALTIPVVYFSQLRTLDAQLAGEAEELFRDLQNFRGAPMNPRQPLSAKFIPVAMQTRWIVLKGPEGQVLYASPGLRGNEWEASSAVGMRSLRWEQAHLRVGSFTQGPYELDLAADLAPLRRLSGDLLRGLLVAAPLAVLVVFLGGFGLAAYAIRPIRDLTDAAEGISVRRLGGRLPMPPAQDEIARLTVVLNNAFDRLEASYQAATRFSADASHQLKTPVAVLRTELEEWRARGAETLAEREAVNVLLRQTRRLTTLIEDLLLLAQADAGRLQLEPATVPLRPLLEASVDDLGTLTIDREVAIEVHLEGPLEVWGDRRRIAIILQNLFENAAKYTPAGGWVRLTGASGPERVVVTLGNSGPGIAEADRAAIFERFRRGGSQGESTSGHGLGLNIAVTLARAQGGDLRLADPTDGETLFVLELPRHPHEDGPGLKGD